MLPLHNTIATIEPTKELASHQGKVTDAKVIEYILVTTLIAVCMCGVCTCGTAVLMVQQVLMVRYVVQVVWWYSDVHRVAGCMHCHK